MKRSMKIVIIGIFSLTIVITLSSLILWQATGGDYYTKFQVVQQIDVPAIPDDPLTAAGFYTDSIRQETVVKNQFRFGLLPTPSRLLDKNMLSVLSLVSPFWFISLLLLWLSRRKKTTKI